MTNYVSNDELMHYGVLGMKWGHRKAQPFSVKATGHRMMSKVYDLNERTYRKSNPTLSSMNRSAKNTQLKLADKAQQAANAKAAQKSAYKAKKVAEKKAARAESIASDKKLISQAESYAAKQSRGKNVAKNLLLGLGGNTTYNMARSMGYGRGKSAARAMLDVNVSTFAGLTVGTAVNAGVAAATGKTSTSVLGGMANGVTQVNVDRAYRNRGRAGSLQQRRMMNEYRSRGR